MLVLTRKPGQRIIIDDRIIISVITAKNGQVRLGIEAPASVHILREELQGTPAIPSALKGRTGVALAVN